MMLAARIKLYIKMLCFDEFFFQLQDGGCTCPGDVAKAIGAGADFVMLGGMLAGHDQSGGEVVENSQTGTVYI